MGERNAKEEKKRKKNGRLPCCEREGMKVGAWTTEEDKILVDFITENGHGTWRNLPKLAGLLRCGKSCRLRWTNYLRPDIKRGPFTPDEENTIMSLHEKLGNKWAAIACELPGRTDNDVKNHWNSHLRKRLCSQAPDPPSSSSKSVQWENVDMEVESHLYTVPLPPLSTPSISNTRGDYFIRLWNSEVGESFRNINESTNEYDGAFSYNSPTSQTSSVTKAESSFRYASEGTALPENVDQKVGIWNCKKETDDFALDDSSDAAMLKMLLDFPVGENDMGFLQRTIDGVYS